VYTGAADAAGPITATDPPPLPFSGSVPPLFFSRPCRPRHAAEVAWCAGW